jgi:hypothetical protein
MNEQLKKRLRGIQAVLMSHYHATINLPNAAKGDEREVLVRAFLEKVFPSPYRFGSGAITDAGGRTSGQLDVIVEWPFFASFPAPLGINRLYLAESTALALEVKSNLSSQWEQVKKTAGKLRPIRRSWQSHVGLKGDGSNIEVYGPSQSRVAFMAVGFTGCAKGIQLREKLQNVPEKSRPDAALVVESGAYASWRSTAEGELGLFAFCLDCSHIMRDILFAHPNFGEYISAEYSEMPKSRAGI